ncbi:MAG TPA: DUF3887 domain-containing protein [Caldisericia bacterium]|mgnify:FL=1|nr:DUF3887 domain-containing protein [Caldisericia bacterium]HOL82793.1 DUF3887 domain-containing protein [Caldisericia bacterium]HON84301.1 DUF3887 domain-containing protein [Caldisericia bacterium]HPC56318.1 DUF3887 domain-containing protein [Caldisericia bacterium]HPP43600.1 DUF3887 domain-containing protein [Caldisericia bacterium]
MKIKIIIFLISLIITLNLSCSKIDVNEVREYADPMTENLLIGRNEKNYEKYSKDFSDKMKEAVSEDKFLESIDLIEGKIGKYIENSKKFDSVTKNNNYIIVTYKAKFTNESNNVTVRTVFEDVNGEMKISGEFYDSPKLRK